MRPLPLGSTDCICCDGRKPNNEGVNMKKEGVNMKKILVPMYVEHYKKIRDCHTCLKMPFVALAIVLFFSYVL
jgi:hypothetical protein